MKQLSCEDLLEIERLLLEGFVGKNIDEVLPVVSLYLRDKIGRISIAKKLGLPERSVRNIVDTMKKFDEHKISVLESLLNKINYSVIIHGKINATVYSGLDKNLLENITKRIVLFRDLLIIRLQDLARLYLIGVKIDKLVFPGVPGDIISREILDLDREVPANSLVVVWSGSYQSIRDDFLVMASLLAFCRQLLQS
ncbi:hypothetical protein ACSU1N_05310 [Thermogladius sp. 4427co]|uniref:hypothetical protein n=1 Tax=Thermogladius sp. 4427co TaxID=3450718 RepID=UPI003F7A69CE